MPKVNNQRRQRRRSSLKRLRLELNGGEIGVPSDPKSVSERSWNTAHYIFDASTSVGGGLLSLQLLHIHINNMLGISLGNRVNFEYRLREFRIWNVTPNEVGSTLKLSGVEMSVYDPLTTTSFTDVHVLHSRTDYPGKNTWAKAGYRYPKHVQNHVLAGSTEADRDIPLLFFEPTDPTATEYFTIRFDFLWRPAHFIDLAAAKVIEPIPRTSYPARNNLQVSGE